MNIFKKYKTVILFIVMVVLFIAGFLDLRYEGLFFQMLPESIQSYIADLFS